MYGKGTQKIVESKYFRKFTANYIAILSAMKNSCLLLFVLFFCSYVLDAQVVQPVATFDSAEVNIARQVRIFPQEKLYLHTDKPYYITGEKIFFRAHVLDALSYIPAFYSRYVYVELINPIDSVVSRLRVRPEDGVFHGQVSLPEDMPEGMYKLRAYTHFMRNVGEEYFFTKNIRIGNPNSLSVKTEVDFEFEKDKTVIMSLRFVDWKQGEPLRPDEIKLRLNRGKTMRIRPDKEGWAKVKLTLPHDASDRVVYVEAEERRPHKQYLRIPYPKDDYEVSFFPEGGHVVAGRLSNVALKALKSNGLPEEVDGEVCNLKGDTLASFSTLDKGLGQFFFSLSKGDSCYVVCRNKAGLEKRFAFPHAPVESPALKARIVKNKIWVEVNTPIDAKDDAVYLLAHTRGAVQYAGRWDASKEFLVFDENDFPSGIVHFLLFSADMKPLSERLVFVRNDDQARVALHPGKPSYKGREKVEAAAEIKDVFLQPLSGNFSVSVTDDREVKVDTCVNIDEQLLLSSDLRGHIDCPACYLKDDKKSVMLLDLLMMTHGWRRYDIAKAARGEFTPLTYALERGQAITGIVKGGLLSKPSEGAKVTVLAAEQRFIHFTETDKDGRFYLHGFEFPDSVRYFVHATSRKGRKTVELIVDRDSFPSVSDPWVYALPPDDRTFQDYVAKADQKYSYENGMRLINLDEVTVKGSYKKDAAARHGSIYGTADNSLTEEDIEKGGFTTIRDMLYRFPGVQVGPDYIRVRNASGNPLLMVDNIEMDIEMLDMLNVSDVEQVDLLKSGHNLALFGSRGGNGVISVYTKRGKITYRDNQMNATVLQPLGYHVPIAFYSPKYDTPEARGDETPDLRSTLYWNPCVKIEPSAGTASLEFYTADADDTHYTVTLEGVSDNGTIIRYSGKIRRE